MHNVISVACCVTALYKNMLQMSVSTLILFLKFITFFIKSEVKYFCIKYYFTYI